MHRLLLIYSNKVVVIHDPISTDGPVPSNLVSPWLLGDWRLGRLDLWFHPLHLIETLEIVILIQYLGYSCGLRPDDTESGGYQFQSCLSINLTDYTQNVSTTWQQKQAIVRSPFVIQQKTLIMVTTFSFDCSHFLKYPLGWKNCENKHLLSIRIIKIF